MEIHSDILKLTIREEELLNRGGNIYNPDMTQIWVIPYPPPLPTPSLTRPPLTAKILRTASLPPPAPQWLVEASCCHWLHWRSLGEDARPTLCLGNSRDKKNEAYEVQSPCMRWVTAPPYCSRGRNWPRTRSLRRTGDAPGCVRWPSVAMKSVARLW